MGMALRRTPFAPGEWYHCFSRGVEKRITFEAPRDYERFIQLLYLCNSLEPVRRDNFKQKSNSEMYETKRATSLVAIGAYCCMPNHFHLLLQEKAEGGISKFMHKVGTAYTMYFNIKNERIGGLFVKPFRSKHVSENLYFAQVAQYIHLNPIELFQPGWKSGAVVDLTRTEQQLREYSYSSLPDYIGDQRPERAILDTEAFDLIASQVSNISDLLVDTAAYYQNLPR